MRQARGTARGGPGALATAATGFVAGAALMFAVCAGVVAAYLVKSALGIDLMAGHSPLHGLLHLLR
jgi:hypothetical protein